MKKKEEENFKIIYDILLNGYINKACVILNLLEIRSFELQEISSVNSHDTLDIT